MKELASEWTAVRHALTAHGLSPVVLGTFACLGFLTEGSRSLLSTDDLDFGILHPSRQVDDAVSEALLSCGFTLKHPGKWQKSVDPMLELDAICEGTPEGRLRSLRVEWWLSWMKMHLADYALPVPFSATGAALDFMTAPTPGAAVLGKSMKIGGYFARTDWPGNRRDVEHAAKAAHDAVVVLADVGCEELRPAFVDQMRDASPAAKASYVRARRSFVEFFGSGSAPGFRLAAPLAHRSGVDIFRAISVSEVLAWQ